MKSQYRGKKSVAKNTTVSISADDPRVAWNNISNTKSRIGAEIDIIGLNGKSLVAGGTGVNNPTGSTATVNPEGTKSKIYIPPSNGRPGYALNADSIIPAPVTNVVAVWSGDDLVITFNWGYNVASNKTVSEFIVELTGEGVTQRTPLGSFTPNRTQTAQTITVTKKINEITFGGNFTVDLSAICVLTMDPFYNVSEKACAATVPVYVLDLPVPVITVTPITSGYSVAYTTPTQSIYDAIEISEYESNATTEPTGVTYTVSYWDSINPANVIVPNINPRWVKARFSSGARIFTAYSAAQKVTPTSPVSLDNTPPNETTNTSAMWSGDNIIVSYKLPAQEAGVRVQIQLTAPNSLVGYFYRFPDGSGRDQVTTITKKDLFDQFGEHYNSFTGVLRSIDAADNKSAGTSFNVPTRTNPLAGITPTFTTVALSNAYSLTFTLPLGAAFAEVYASHTDWVGDPSESLVVYAGLSPAVITDTDYTTTYIVIRYYDDFGNVSNYSAKQTVIPLNPGEITSFENPISFGENAVIFAGSSPTSGTRTLFKTGGIFAYDATNASPSTQIVSNASAGTPTFITTQAQIADWNITETKIENTLAGAPTKYTGLSATGTYSFWAGSDVSGGNSSADFTVTPTGIVTARNITIIGNGNASSNLISAGGLFTVKNDGTVTATGVDITGKITASSGSFTGNLSIGSTGSIYSGTLSGNNISGAGFILNQSGLLFNSSSVNAITTINGSTGRLITKSAEIGDWTVDENSISKTFSGNGKIKLDSVNGYISVSNTNEVNKLAGINAATGATDSVFWSGGTNPNAITNPFRVTFAGKLYATDAEISGKISAETGYIGTATDGWTIGQYGITATGNGRIRIGNYDVKSMFGTDFTIYDHINDQSILTTDTLAGFARIYLGQVGRQVEVAKNAEISGAYSGSEQDYRSGGLRNMYTITQNEYAASAVTVFSSAPKGSVLLVYDPSS